MFLGKTGVLFLCAGAEEGAEAEDQQEEEEEQLPAEEEEEEVGEIVPDEGYELVDADDEPVTLFQMPEDDPEMTLENVAAFEAADDNEVDMEIDVKQAMPAGAPGQDIVGTVRHMCMHGTSS